MIAQRPLGNTGLKVSILGYGGAPIGFSAAQDTSAFIRLLQRALDAGINFFDTARDYRQSEELLGAALHQRRDHVVLATKCGRVQQRRSAEWEAYEDWSAAGIERQIESSLRLLRTDYLDLVQLHSPSASVLDDGTAIVALQRAQAAGKVRHIGVSADDAVAWQAVELGVFATLQVSYSMLQQEPGTSLLPAAAARGMGIIIKQPVANGVADLTTRPPHPDWASKWDTSQRMSWGDWGAHNERTALALRWLLSNPLVSTAIVGTTSAAHLDANIALAALPALDSATYKSIEVSYRVARQRLQQEQGS